MSIKKKEESSISKIIKPCGYPRTCIKNLGIGFCSWAPKLIAQIVESMSGIGIKG
jgi:hypothetical protein